MAGRFDHIQEVCRSGRYDHLVEVTKFNPYHDARGRFSSAPGGGLSVAMGVGGAAPAGTRAAVSGTLSQVEQKNKDLDHEVATIINPKNGKVIFAKEGGASGLSFNSSEAREIAGKVLTHNHPDELIFSPADVMMAYHVDTIRATTPSGAVYELRGLNRKDAIMAYQQHYMDARAASFRDLGIAEGTLDRQLQGAQRTGSFSAISDSCHKWLTDNAAQYGYQYNKGRIG